MIAVVMMGLWFIFNVSAPVAERRTKGIVQTTSQTRATTARANAAQGLSIEGGGRYPSPRITAALKKFTSDRAQTMLSILSHPPPSSHTITYHPCPPPPKQALINAASSIRPYAKVQPHATLKSGGDVGLQGHPITHHPIVNFFYNSRKFGRVDRLREVRQKWEKDDVCPEFQMASMLQTRALNQDYFFVEQGKACKRFCKQHCLNHITLDENASDVLFSRLHLVWPELAGMNAEFTFAYARMFHMWEVAQLLDVDIIGFNDGDSMPYTSIGHMAGHFIRQGIDLTYCTYFPRANNLYSYFSVNSLEDLIVFAAATVEDGHGYSSAGDMAWLLSYAAASFNESDLECYAADYKPPFSAERHRGKCRKGYTQLYRPKKFKPSFIVGNTCRSWDNGVGSDAVQVDREKVYETYGEEDAHKRVVWVGGFPYFVRKDTHQLERVWYIHFQGTQKKYQKNFLRRYDIEACWLQWFGEYCECTEYSCSACVPSNPLCGMAAGS